MPGDDGVSSSAGGRRQGELILPPPARGVQLKVTSPPVPKGTEETGCHYFKLPVRRRPRRQPHPDRRDRRQPSHPPLPRLRQDRWTCRTTTRSATWPSTSTSGSWSSPVQLRKTDWELPPGVAFHFRAGEQLLMQTHFVNVGSLETVGEGKALMNLQARRARNDHRARRRAVRSGQGRLRAGALATRRSRRMRVPEGAQPDRADRALSLPRPALQYVSLGRRRARRPDLPLRGLQRSAVRASTIRRSRSPPGQGLQWECYWENPTDNDYKFGPFTDTNEHCNWFAFYYPTDSLDESITCVTQDNQLTMTVRGGR